MDPSFRIAPLVNNKLAGMVLEKNELVNQNVGGDADRVLLDVQLETGGADDAQASEIVRSALGLAGDVILNPQLNEEGECLPNISVRDAEPEEPRVVAEPMERCEESVPEGPEEPCYSSSEPSSY